MSPPPTTAAPRTAAATRSAHPATPRHPPLQSMPPPPANPIRRTSSHNNYFHSYHPRFSHRGSDKYRLTPLRPQKIFLPKKPSKMPIFDYHSRSSHPSHSFRGNPIGVGPES